MAKQRYIKLFAAKLETLRANSMPILPCDRRHRCNEFCAKFASKVICITSAHCHKRQHPTYALDGVLLVLGHESTIQDADAALRWKVRRWNAAQPTNKHY